MTSTLDRPLAIDPHVEPRRAVLVTALVAGVALGIADLLLQAALPYPWANLANSSAVWALAAFGYGAWTRVPGRPEPGARVAVGGAVLLVTAVASYYVAAAVVLDDAIANLWAPTSLLWAMAGVVAGAAFGVGGSWCRRPGWRGVTAAAGAGAVCFAEYGLLLRRVDDAAPDLRTELLQTAVLTAVLGLVALVAAARTVPVIGRALLLAVPLTALGYVGFSLAGLSG